MTTHTITCKVPKMLYSDWESRGIIHGLGDTIKTYVAMRGKGIRIVGNYETMRGLRDDAEWLLDPCMEQDAQMKRACRMFIAGFDAGGVFGYE